jgi:acyl-CoA synthetase (AMP-forming)/AMP-acid ligase II
MISHRNIIANMLQYSVYEQPARKKLGVETQVGLGVLPFSHAYGLHVVALGNTWRGDELIVLPKFELTTYLKAIERFKITALLVVPPIVIRMLSSIDECRKYDLSSVRLVYVGAAPTGKETVDELHKHWPHWNVCQGYGMTETATCVSTTSEDDILNGTSGSLLPGIRIKVMGFDGKEITAYDTPGEMMIQSPTTTLGYLNNEMATSEAFVWDEDGRWMKTGDEVVVTKSPKGYEHIKVVDRIKELIKVKVRSIQTPPFAFQS